MVLVGNLSGTNVDSVKKVVVREPCVEVIGKNGNALFELPVPMPNNAYTFKPLKKKDELIVLLREEPFILILGQNKRGKKEAHCRFPERADSFQTTDDTRETHARKTLTLMRAKEANLVYNHFIAFPIKDWSSRDRLCDFSFFIDEESLPFKQNDFETMFYHFVKSTVSGMEELFVDFVTDRRLLSEEELRTVAEAVFGLEGLNEKRRKDMVEKIIWYFGYRLFHQVPLSINVIVLIHHYGRATKVFANSADEVKVILDMISKRTNRLMANVFDDSDEFNMSPQDVVFAELLTDTRNNPDDDEDSLHIARVCFECYRMSRIDAFGKIISLECVLERLRRKRQRRFSDFKSSRKAIN